MDEEWIKELKSVPFKSSKLFPGVNMYIGAHGRTIFLLKAKAKSNKPRAQKKMYEMVKPKLPHEHEEFINAQMKAAMQKKAEETATKMEGITKAGK